MAVGVGEDEGAEVVRGEPNGEGHLRGRGGLRAGEHGMRLDHLNILFQELFNYVSSSGFYRDSAHLPLRL